MEPEELTKFSLFSTLDADQRKWVAKLFVVEHFEEDHRIFAEGDSGDRLYLIGAGKIRITQRLGADSEDALAILEVGDYFGEMSLIDAQPRSADAVAGSKVTTYSVGRSEFLLLLRTNAGLAVTVLFQFIRTLTGRLRSSNERMRVMNLLSMWS